MSARCMPLAYKEKRKRISVLTRCRETLTQTMRLSCLLIMMLTTRQVYADEIVVIVNPATPFSTMTAAEVRLIFMAKNKTLPDHRPVVPLMLQEETPTRVSFDQVLLQSDSRESRAYWAQMIFTGRGKPPRQLADDTAMKKEVANNPNALGYIRRSSLDSSVKAVFTLKVP